MLTEDFPSLQVPPDEYHETCLFAYCVGATAGSGPEGQLEAVCTTFANYAQACARQHIYVHWRKPGFCGMLGLPISNELRSLSGPKASWLSPMAYWICKANASWADFFFCSHRTLVSRGAALL